MRTIRKNAEPASLREYRAGGGDYDDCPCKGDLREALVSEQRGICCYCMGRISSGFRQMKIEHWHPQQPPFLHEQLQYRNLLGACMGGEGEQPQKQHCDTRKGDRLLKWNPADPDRSIEDQVAFLADGRISSDDLQLNQELNSVLNLNVARLKENRLQTLDALKETLARNTTKNQLERLLREWNGESSGSPLPPYCQVVVQWLRKGLRRYS